MTAALRIVVMTDVHGNLPALRAALADITRHGYDRLYHTGDAFAIGPCPAECLDLLLTTPRTTNIMGNHEAWFVDDYLLPAHAEHLRWIHEQLDPSLRPVIARWPFILRETWHGLSVSFNHYALDATGRDFAPIIEVPNTSDFDRLYAGDPARIVWYGHDHIASDLTGQRRYVNPGSLGCHTAPSARYARLDIAPDGTYTLEQRAVPYDDADLFRELERRQVPEREWVRRTFFPRERS